MIAPLPALLEAVASRVPAELASPHAWKRVRERAKDIPSAWDCAVFECRLDRSPQLDLIVGALPGKGGQHSLAAVDDHEVFGRAADIVRAWTSDAHPLARAMPVLWLEYDLPEGQPAPDPFAFVALWSDWLGPVYPRPPRGLPPPAADVRAIAELGLTVATGEAPPEDVMERLERCAASLPEHGRLLHAVRRPKAGSEDVRVGAVLPADAVRQWLHLIGWPGSDRAYERLRRLVGDGWSMLHVQVELGREGVRPHLSIDYNRIDTFDWDRLAEGLVRERAAVPERAGALRRWIGTEAFTPAWADWRAVIERRVFCKLTAHDAEALEAKAYLCLQPRYVLF